MSKKEKSSPKGKSRINEKRDSKLIINQRSIEGRVRAWQPTVDRTTTPPTGEDDKKK